MKNTTETSNTFIMPASVATAILSDPRNKMTNKMRKRAQAARETAVLSKAPVLTYPGGGLVRTVARKAGMKKQPQYAVGRSKTGGEKIVGRLKGRKFRQLLIWEKRIGARIKILEKVLVTLSGVLETVVAEHVQNRIKALHAVGALVQQEIDARG